MTHLSLPPDITEKQMLDVMTILEKGLPLDDNGKIDLELNAMHLVEFSGSRVDYCRALQRLVNSEIW